MNRLVIGAWAVVLGLALAAGASARAPIVVEGVVRSDGRVEVKAKVSAPIRQIAVEEGRVVRAGGLLVEMSNDVPKAEVARAQAGVGRAESAVEEAELAREIAARELERNLKVPDLITARDLDLSRDAVKRAEADLRTRKDEVARARAELAVTEAALADTRILAPFDGLVSRVLLRPGATPKVAETTILEFLTLEHLYIEVGLPLPYLKQVRPGMAAAVTVEDEHAAVTARATGSVRHVYPEIDPTTRMFRVKVDVPSLGGRVLPGMFARVSLLPSDAPRPVR